MDFDLFLGSHELIDAVCRIADADPTRPVPVREVVHEVGWVVDDAQIGLERLARAGLLAWPTATPSVDPLIAVTPLGLRFWAADAWNAAAQPGETTRG